MIHRLRAVLATLVDGLSTRFDLASVELEDLLARLGVLAGLVFGGILVLAIAFLFVGLAIVFALPPTGRWIASLLLAALAAGGAAWCYVNLRRCLKEMPAPFAATREVLRRDIRALRPEDIKESAAKD